MGVLSIGWSGSWGVTSSLGLRGLDEATNEDGMSTPKFVLIVVFLHGKTGVLHTHPDSLNLAYYLVEGHGFMVRGSTWLHGGI